MYNPLEQFKIMIVQKMNIMGIDLSITNNTSVLLFISIIFYLILGVNYQKRSFIPSKWQHIIEELYNFVIQLFRQQISNLLALKYFPIVLFLFSFILLSNLIGLVPYGFTITGHIVVTFQLALTMFVGITIINICNNQLAFLNLFVPSGVPKALLPFLVIIEVVSYLIRPFSLAVRLFANMLAGHTLLNILSGFTFSMLKKGMLMAIIPIVFVVFIVILEFCIAAIQAYIFCILVSIYINDIYSLH